MEEQPREHPQGGLEPLYTKEELGRLLKVCGRTIERMVEAGAFPPPLRVGCRPRWRAGDVARYLDRQASQGAGGG